MPGTWSVATDFPAITVKRGLEKKRWATTGTVLAAKGSNLMDDRHMKNAHHVRPFIKRDNRSAEEMMTEALAVANQSDIIVG